MEPIFEASSFRSEILKEIDQDFALIKKDKKSLAANKKLVKDIKQFTGIKDIVITLKKDYYNAAVFSVYNQALSTDIINVFKDYKVDGDIKDLDVVEEPSKYIKKLYIVFGSDLIGDLSPRELTAIILHELGHSFNYTANLPRLFLSMFKNIIDFTGKILAIPTFAVSLLISSILMRTLTFLDHRGEYKADQFAIKYGYADDIVKVLYKFHNKEVEMKDKQAWWEKILWFIGRLISPSTHPTSSSRIEEINNQMLNDYKKLYPKLSKELSIILQDVKSSS